MPGHPRPRPRAGRGPGATAHLDDRIVVRTPAGTVAEHLGVRSSYTYQLEAFARSVRGGEPFPTDADDAVVTMELIDRCHLAAGLKPRPATD